MKLNFFQPHMPSFGLQLNGSSLKLMQLRRSGGKVHVQSYSYVSLPKNLMANDAIVDQDGLAALIRRSIEKPAFGSISTNRVSISLPESKSFVRVMQIPVTNESQVESAVMFEAESYVPMPMDQVYFDWKIVRKLEGAMEVLIVASPKETVDAYINVLEKAHLKPIAVEVESQSLERALINQKTQETALLIDIDAWQTNLIMIERGNLQFTSSIPIAGSTFTERISQALGVTPQKAESIKREVGLTSTPEYPNIKAALQPVLISLSEEIKNIIKFHYDHSQEKITTVLLCGGNASTKNLPEALTEALKDIAGVPVVVSNPWVNLPEIQDPPLSYEQSLNFTAAIGLAIRTLED
jgi:type IV pilus assembly protein PilM